VHSDKFVACALRCCNISAEPIRNAYCKFVTCNIFGSDFVLLQNCLEVEGRPDHPRCEHDLDLDLVEPQWSF